MLTGFFFFDVTRSNELYIVLNPQRLRSVHAKKTEKKDGSMRREDAFSSAAPAVRNKSKRKEGDSDEDEDEEDDSEEQRDDDDEYEEEPGVKREKKTDMCEEEVSKNSRMFAARCWCAVAALTRPRPPGHQCAISHRGRAGEDD